MSLGAEAEPDASRSDLTSARRRSRHSPWMRDATRSRRGATLSNDAEITSPADAARGRSEWDAERMAQRATEAVRAVAGSLGPRRGEVAGLGLTGQQHGVVVVDGRSRRTGPFIGWQDRRGLDPLPGDDQTFLARAARLSGPATAARTGCALATGFMGVTLFWLKETGGLPATGTACFITDYLGALLTGGAPVTDPTMGASSGLFHLAERRWDSGDDPTPGAVPGLFPRGARGGGPVGSADGGGGAD